MITSARLTSRRPWRRQVAEDEQLLRQERCPLRGAADFQQVLALAVFFRSSKEQQFV